MRQAQGLFLQQIMDIPAGEMQIVVRGRFDLQRLELIDQPILDELEGLEVAFDLAAEDRRKARDLAFRRFQSALTLLNDEYPRTGVDRDREQDTADGQGQDRLAA